jgi:MarR family 2-MHQ and catechol resistance regulon transcriptional repressor
MAAIEKGRSARYQALLQLLRTADTVWEASRVFFERWDLSPSQFNVLNLLEGLPEGLTQIELGRLLITHRSNVTGLVDRLEKRGLVVRQEVPQDRRAYQVVLTPRGRELVDQILPEYRQVAEEVWEGFAAHRAQSLTADLARLSGNAVKLAEGRKQRGGD